MKAVETNLKDCYIIEPLLFGDARGFFFESYNKKKFDEITQTSFQFVQDNHSKSSQGVLRGLHYQVKQVQGKLVRVIQGEVLDVVVDLRKSSPTFGKSMTAVLSAENKKQIWIPPGFAHGFLVRSEVAEFLYKTTDFYAPEYEKTLIWNDPDLKIDWQINKAPLLSKKDESGALLKNAEIYP